MDRLPTPRAEASPTPYRPLFWLAAAAGLGIVADLLIETHLGAPLFGVWWWGGTAFLLISTLVQHAGRGLPFIAPIRSLPWRCLASLAVEFRLDGRLGSIRWRRSAAGLRRSGAR